MSSNKRNIEFILHILIWMVLFILPVAISIATGWRWQEVIPKLWVHLVLIAVIFYINYVFLFDYFIKHNRKSIIEFIAANALLIVGMIAMKVYVFQWITESRILDSKAPPIQLAWYMDFIAFTVPVAMAIAIKVGKNMVEVQEMKVEAENIKLQSELQHLKFQFQPHFIFNSLNNIYSLIEIDATKAQESVHSLSGLMRHFLKNTDDAFISLREEIGFLTRYIDLMRLRISDEIQVNANFPKIISEVYITPLIFITVVENAFKHGISANNPSRIEFNLSVVDDFVVFSSSNNYFPKRDEDLSRSGIGLKNLKKRLDILYPDKHKLKYHVEDDYFFITLKIPSMNKTNG